MNQEDELARRIAKLLDESAERIGPEQKSRLAQARERALARYRPQREHAWAPALAGYFSRFTERRVLGVRYLVPTAVLVLGVAGIAYVQQTRNTSEAIDVELGLLTDELPIRAYLDKGFDSWLKRYSR
jgi:hypothetical protein